MVRKFRLDKNYNQISSCDQGNLNFGVSMCLEGTQCNFLLVSGPLLCWIFLLHTQYNSRVKCFHWCWHMFQRDTWDSRFRCHDCAKSQLFQGIFPWDTRNSHFLRRYLSCWNTCRWGTACSLLLRPLLKHENMCQQGNFCNPTLRPSRIHLNRYHQGRECNWPLECYLRRLNICPQGSQCMPNFE